MKSAVVGGGMLGLSLAWRLAQRGHAVSVFEAAPVLGGLCVPQDYGEFVWDRFYHVILPRDGSLLGLLGELGLGPELVWRATGTGYFARGRFHAMSGALDFLRFPLLSAWDKARLGAAVLYATRVARPARLHGVTAEAWLTRLCGRRGYEAFWRPLLRAKFGALHDRVAAVFIWATLRRLFGARDGAARESMGYVRGGYRRVLARLEGALAERGVALRASTPVRAIRLAGAGCEVEAGGATERFEQVFFTGPTSAARGVAEGDLAAVVERAAREHPAAGTYLGVVCLTLVLDRPLTPWYVLNIGDAGVELTGLIEMTNLVDRAETHGRSLVYLPRYLASADPCFDEPDEGVYAALVERGLRRLFPGFRDAWVVRRVVSRARQVQPLPLAGIAPAQTMAAPRLERPFTVLNTSMLRCATLNNNEVVGLADAFVDRHGPALTGAG